MIKIMLITLGDTPRGFIQTGVAEYTKRIARFAQFQHKHLKESKDSDEKIIAMIKTYTPILLDEEGELVSSEIFAQRIEKTANQSQSLCFIIGGPDGHSDYLKKNIRQKMSLSPLTLPHDMASLFFIETLYRSLSLMHNHPYHRG